MMEEKWMILHEDLGQVVHRALLGLLWASNVVSHNTSVLAEI